MSIYTTKEITREEALELLELCRNVQERKLLLQMSDKEIEDELDAYSIERTECLSNLYDDILGWGYNYLIK